MARTQNQSQSSLSIYMSEINKIPMLSREDELALAEKTARGCERSLNRLVEANLRFVVSVAREYRNRGVPLEDLISAGNAGLIEAARRFDPDHGNRFISWAVWWIRRDVLKTLSTQSRTVRLPESQTRKMKELRELEARLAEQLDRAPTDDEILAAQDGKLLVLDPIHRHGIRLTSLDAPLGGDAGSDTFGDALEDDEQLNPEDKLMRSQAIACVDALIDELDERERDVVASRFGLRGNKRETLQQVGDRIGLSREAVRLIEHKARHYMAQRFEHGFYSKRERPIKPESMPAA